MNRTISSMTTPSGTYGLAVEPWSKGEIYAVAANWAEASSPVLSYGEDGWHHTGKQVADYRHSPEEALRDVLAEALVAGGDEPDDADDLVSDAVNIDDGSDEDE